MQDIYPRPPKKAAIAPEGSTVPDKPTPERVATPLVPPSPMTPVARPQHPPLATKLSIDTSSNRKKKRLYGFLIAITAVVVVAVVAASAGWYWYVAQLQPVDSRDTTKKTIKITAGMTPDQIGSYLAKQGMIRNEMAFSIYTRLHNMRGGLQAGDYKIAPSESMEQVVAHILSGKSDTFTLTFYPGATLYDPAAATDTGRTDVSTLLKRAGYEDGEIRRAFSKQYAGSLFAGKPVASTLEGYVYGETYQFTAGSSVEDILQRTFDEYAAVIKETKLEAAAKKRNLSLYQMITLASIVQKEVKDPVEQRQVAQVFYARLEKGMPLGSDVTFIYAAKQLGKEPLPDLDSPYNTRIHAGLPPGPIAVPGKSALQAVAAPSSGDYLYFVAGDDGKTYFSRTLQEHEDAVAKHCTTLCQ